jgi:hypothetical protein
LTVGAVAAAGVVSTGFVVDVHAIASAGSHRTGLSIESVKRNIGGRFIVRNRESGRETFLKLVEFKDIKNPADRELGIERESYSLLFEGDPRDVLEQGVYEFPHTSMPNSELLLVPVTADPGVYEVNFNSYRS